MNSIFIPWNCRPTVLCITATGNFTQHINTESIRKHMWREEENACWVLDRTEQSVRYKADRTQTSKWECALIIRINMYIYIDICSIYSDSAVLFTFSMAGWKNGFGSAATSAVCLGSRLSPVRARFVSTPSSPQMSIYTYILYIHIIHLFLFLLYRFDCTNSSIHNTFTCSFDGRVAPHTHTDASVHNIPPMRKIFSPVKMVRIVEDSSDSDILHHRTNSYGLGLE